MQIWTYVITHDYGSAPNYEGGYTTLAICKPAIRRGAKTGDMVIAFNTAKKSRPHSVCWAGIVYEVMPIADYWNDKRFACKKPDHSDVPDNIYKPNTHDRLVWVRNKIHKSDQIARDTGGMSVLVFKERWYFGVNGSDMPEPFGLRMAPHNRRGHHRHEDRDADLPKLRKWFDEQDGTSPPTSKTAHDCVCSYESSTQAKFQPACAPSRIQKIC